jgi:hypothetical protein
MKTIFFQDYRGARHRGLLELREVGKTTRKRVFLPTQEFSRNPSPAPRSFNCMQAHRGMDTTLTIFLSEETLLQMAQNKEGQMTFKST